MAHFAELDDNDVVVNVIVVADEDCLDEDGNESESVGVAYLTELFKHDRWVQTSINTRNGEHLNNRTPLRFHCAFIGGTYDRKRDAFLFPKPSDTSVLDEDTLLWVEPAAE